MEKIINLRIHVAPVGFEIDRVVIPAERRKADVVWLMVSDNNDLAQDFFDKIKERLAKHNISVKTKVHNRMDLFDIIRAAREIIQDEESNTVFVNLSSGSKIQAVGCMMACMMFSNRDNIHPYYADPETYYERPKRTPLSHGVRDIIDLPHYEIRIPDDHLVETMVMIRDEPSGRIKKATLVYKLVEAGIIHVTDTSFMGDDSKNRRRSPVPPGALASLNNRILRHLQRWKFIHIEKVGRSQWISLTDAGLNATRFLQNRS